MTQTLSGDMLHTPWQLAALMLVTVFLGISFARLLNVMRDPRLIILTAGALRFRAWNTVFRNIPWSRFDAIDIGPLRNFCLVHYRSEDGRPKTIRLQLNLLDGTISERMLAELQDFPVEVREITRG
ncbi:hypothetical protein [Ruegeria sp. Ofav3-42]|uniref:hypothetical protein n=1 Tax=Ruegeria sp. Ofav3-42 TaxID=2917759 RepID=UPI001EF464EA|nr:hypothetical protein [Ruegeria sp. Ofav3-42]MCG7519701.1 hypothetical protein [Ruegeria sp. Ofav3-42]